MVQCQIDQSDGRRRGFPADDLQSALAQRIAQRQLSHPPHLQRRPPMNRSDLAARELKSREPVESTEALVPARPGSTREGMFPSRIVLNAFILHGASPSSLALSSRSVVVLRHRWLTISCYCRPLLDEWLGVDIYGVCNTAGRLFLFPRPEGLFCFSAPLGRGVRRRRGESALECGGSARDTAPLAWRESQGERRERLERWLSWLLWPDPAAPEGDVALSACHRSSRALSRGAYRICLRVVRWDRLPGQKGSSEEQSWAGPVFIQISFRRFSFFSFRDGR